MGVREEGMPTRSFGDAAFDASPIATFLLDDDLRCLALNRAACGETGLTADHARGRPLRELVPHLAIHLDGIARVTLESGAPFLDLHAVAASPRAPDAERTWVLSCYPVADSPPLRLVLTVTAHPEAPVPTRRDNESLFREIFERAPIGLLVLEWRGQALRINEAFCAMIGYTPEELAGGGIQAVTHPDDWPADLENFRRLLSGETDHYRLVKRYLRKDGSVLFGELAVSMLRDERGQPSLIISMVRDVSEPVRAEEERDRLIRELEAAVRAREVFLSIASHELNTPITALQLVLQVLQRKLPNAPAELELVIRQTTRLSVLVATLLEADRDVACGVGEPRERLALDELVAETCERLRPLSDQARCASTVRIEGAIPIWGNRVRIEQVLTALFANAVKFGAGRPIEIVVERREQCAELTVRDHGMGVAAEHHARIFERFERVASTAYGGLGLGLYVARQIVQAHEGTIRVESAPGEGAAFIVTLPLCPA